MNIEHHLEGDIIFTDTVAFTYQVGQTPKDFEPFRDKPVDIDFQSQRNFIGDYVVIPNGTGNALPKEIKDAVQKNYVAPGILKRKTNLLWGIGPYLYVPTLVDNEEVKQQVHDKDIEAWLDTWDYQDYLLKCCVDYNHMESCYTKFQLTKGGRIGKPTIAFLEHIQQDKANLAFHKDNANGARPTHIVVTDWSFKHINSLDCKAYPIFDYYNPFKYPTTMYYSNMYSFCSDFYTVPDIYGALEWLKRSTAVPLIFKALSKNSINLKYHVISPQAFWDAEEEKIKDRCLKKNVTYKESMFLEFKTKYLKKIGRVLAGDENVGKYLHTTKTLEVDGTNLLEHGWEVKVIDQNIKNFVEAQIEISKHSAQSLSIGISMSSSLSNTSDTAKANSGSEQYYSMINYLNTDVNIPEVIVLKAMNFALKVNFPGKGIKMGFKHRVPERTSEISPSNRIQEQTN